MNKPYGYLIGEGFGQKFIPANGFFAKREDLSNAIPLYTHPVKQLSDEEISQFEYQIIRACGLSTANSDINSIALKRIIEEITE